MQVVPLVHPGLAVESDSPAAPSETAGADFATLMAAMAAASLAPPPALATPLTGAGPLAGGGPQAQDTGCADSGASPVLPTFGWAGPTPMTGTNPDELPVGSVSAGPAPPSSGVPASGGPDGKGPGTTASTGPADGLTGAPAVPAGTAAGAAGAGGGEIAPTSEISGRESAPTGGTNRARISESVPGPAAEPVAFAVSGQPSAGTTDETGEPASAGAGSKPATAVATGQDRVLAPGHGAGPLMGAEASRTVDGPSHASGVQHPPVVEQVVSVVEPLRHRGDGHHELTLDLRPAELGPIRVEVSIDQGTVHLSLHADEASTGRLLHQAMPELRAALEEAGLVAGQLGVGPGDREGGRPPAQSRAAEGDEPTAPRPQAAAAAAIRPPAAPAAGALDLLL